MRNEREVEEVKQAFDDHKEILSEAGIQDGEVLPEDLIEYFSGDTPTGDKTTLDDVLSNRWLLLHEIIELRHLKLKGIKITRDVLWERYEDVLDAHFAATAIELKLALRHNDREWIASRVGLILSWLDDPEMPEKFRSAGKKLMEHYSL